MAIDESVTDTLEQENTGTFENVGQLRRDLEPNTRSIFHVTIQTEDGTEKEVPVDSDEGKKIIEDLASSVEQLTDEDCREIDALTKKGIKMIEQQGAEAVILTGRSRDFMRLTLVNGGYTGKVIEINSRDNRAISKFTDDNSGEFLPLKDRVERLQQSIEAGDINLVTSPRLVVFEDITNSGGKAGRYLEVASSIPGLRNLTYLSATSLYGRGYVRQQLEEQGIDPEKFDLVDYTQMPWGEEGSSFYKPYIYNQLSKIYSMTSDEPEEGYMPEEQRDRLLKVRKEFEDKFIKVIQ
jgi:hypothetical protein